MHLFFKINENELEEFLKELEVDYITFKKDSIALSTLKTSQFIGYIISGKIEIIREDYDGNRTVLEDIEENETFGSHLSSLMNKENKIIAKEETKVILIDYNRIINYQGKKKAEYTQLLKNLFQITTEKMEEKNERIQILTEKTIRNKLLTYLETQSKKNRSKNIYLPFSFIDLASYLSVDRSALSREMGYLKKEGFIEVKGRRITLKSSIHFDRDYDLL